MDVLGRLLAFFGGFAVAVGALLLWRFWWAPAAVACVGVLVGLGWAWAGIKGGVGGD